MKLAPKVFLIPMLLCALTSCQSRDGQPAPSLQPQGTEQPTPSTDSQNSNTVENKPQSYVDMVEKQMQEAKVGDYLHSQAGKNSSQDRSISYQLRYCADGLDCQNKYVQVIIKHDGQEGECSGVLIAENLVLTNRHCAGLVTSTANTSFERNSISILFPFKNRKASDVGTDPIANFPVYADNIVIISPKDLPNPVSSPDWAIVKLNDFKLPKGFQVPRQNREGIKDGETYFVYSYSPFGTNDGARAEIKKWACQATYKTIFAPWFDRPLLPVVGFTDCPIGPGNSGSPVYNKAGELVGIIGGQFNPDSTNALTFLAQFEFGLIPAQGKPIQWIGWGMNLACIPDVKSFASLPNDCDASLGRENEKLKVDDDLKEKAMQKLGQSSGDSTVFNFINVMADNEDTISGILTQVLAIRVPACVHVQALKTAGPEGLKVKIDYVGMMLNLNGTLNKKLTEVRKMDAQIELDPSTLDSAGSAQMKIQILNGRSTLYHSRVKACTN